MAREEIQDLRAAVGPDLNVVLVVARAREREIALHLLGLGPDADLPPLLGDHLGLGRPRHEGLDGLNLNAQALAVVRAHAEALAVLFREPDGVEQLVGLAPRSSIDHFLRHSVPGKVGDVLARHRRSPVCRRRARTSR